MDSIKGLTISESEYKLDNGRNAKLAVFIYSGAANPKSVLDAAINKYVGDNGYHELIDANLDNPWMRVILTDINHIHQEQFNPNKHQLVVSN